MAEKPVERLVDVAPLRKQVYQRLEDMIIYGLLHPGEHLVESDLAQRLGVSRIPIREALQLLHGNGWVDLRPRFGAFVHSPTLQEVDDMFDVRTLLEMEAARLAAQNVDEDTIEALKATLSAGESAVESGDEEELVKLNSVFHGQITAMAGNQVLGEMLGRLDKRVRWYFTSVATSRGRASWREHGDLVKALEARDSVRATEIMRKHAELTKAAYHQTGSDC